jgi:hypothetical protein
MIVCCVNSCAYCGSPIEPEQRWVRVKIYDPALKDRAPSYRRFHAEPFAGQHECCWEKHQLDLELSRTTTRAA